MRGWVDAFASMLEEASRAPLPPGWEIEAGRTVLAAGMGGSGMAGHLAAIHLQEKGERVFGWREPRLPGWVGPEDALLLISYSGETWEALALLDAALAQSIPVRIVASGGEIESRAASEGLPFFRVPAGMAPRAALPWLLVAALRALPRWNREEIDAAASGVRAAVADPAPGGDPREIARALEGRIPWLLPVGSAMEAVALRWRNQLLENAEIPCLVSPIPEMAHNEIMGWPGLRSLGLRPVFLLLDGGESMDRRLERLLGALESEAGDGGLVFLRLPPPRGAGLAATLALVHLGDRVSVELADRLGVAASPVETIRRLRERCRKESER